MGPSRQRCGPVPAYGVALALCLVVTVWSLRLWRADWHVPFADAGDTYFTQLWIQGMVENGWYLHNPRVGAPGGLDLHDFPLLDNLHFGVLKLLSLATADAAFLFNLYYVLAFPAVTLATLFAFRQFRVAFLPSLLVSLLYTFLPYHFARGMVGHLFLANYSLVPLVCMVAIWLYLDGSHLLLVQGRGSGTTPQFQKAKPRSRVRGRVVLSVLVALLMSGGGVYYACFGCFFLIIAGVSAAYRLGSLAPVARALGLVAIVFLGSIANLWPNITYRVEHGPNDAAVQRDIIGPEVYGMKITQLLLPTSVHRIRYFSQTKAAYNATFPWGNGDYWYLGVFGGLGFLALLGRLLFSNRPNHQPGLLDALAVLNLAAILLATVGGFGSTLGLLAAPYIRCYERMSIFIAFFSLFAIAAIASRHVAHFVGVRYASFAAALLLGLLDLTSSQFVPDFGRLQEEFIADREFVEQIEAHLEPGAMVFQLPYVPFPENPPVVHMADYDHLRGYLHSASLRWSYGAIKGRAGNLLAKCLAESPVEELPARLAQAGFRGIWIDRHGYADHGKAVEAGIAAALRSDPMVSKDGRIAFFVLPCSSSL